MEIVFKFNITAYLTHRRNIYITRRKNVNVIIYFLSLTIVFWNILYLRATPKPVRYIFVKVNMVKKIKVKADGTWHIHSL